jgi:uncharacterized repeat protein (TIGR03847 family)
VTDIYEFDDLDRLGAGAFGVPGQRTFVVQLVRDGVSFTVVLEKEQVRILARETLRFLDRIDAEQPEPMGAPWGLDGSVREAVPAFRARMLGIGYDPAKARVVVELREWPDDDEPSADDLEALGLPEPRVARILATRAQARAMAVNAMAAVDAGRPACPLCEQPMDPAGHWCPRSN